jgi:hypothetical protein
MFVSDTTMALVEDGASLESKPLDTGTSGFIGHLGTPLVGVR